MGAPNKFDDPYWTNLALATEKKLGIPSGLLHGVLTKGERSNADQVSEVGAKTPFQITPETRNLVLKKYGVDAYLSPENSAEAGGLLLKESLARNKGNKAIAVAEYHGGVDRNNWGPRTKAYVKRVMGSDITGQQPASAGGSTFSRLQAQRQQEQAAKGPSIKDRLAAYQAGEMTPEDAAKFETDINSGKIMLPKGAIQQNTGPMPLPKGVMEAYRSGNMLRKDMIQLEADIANGLVALPPGQTIGKTEPLSMMGKVADVFTGNERETTETKTLRDWTEFNTPRDGATTNTGDRGLIDSIGGFLSQAVTGTDLTGMTAADVKTGIGTMLTSPEETVKVIQANFPGTTVRQDTKGNYILRNPKTGEEFAVPPGVTASDAPRIVGGIAAMTPAGRATTVAGSAAASAATQAAVEGSQYLTGGDFDPNQVVLAGGIGGGIPLASRLAKATKQAIRGERLPVTPVAPQPVAPSARPDIAPTQAPTQAAAPAAEVTQEEIGDLVRRASGSGMGSESAKIELASLAKINKEAMAAAERQGIVLPADVFSDSARVMQTSGLTRSVAGSEASAAWEETVKAASTRADEVMKTLGATDDIAKVSDDVKSALSTTRDDLEREAKAIYETVNIQVPKKTVVELTNLRKTLNDITEELGGTAAMSKEERRLAKMASDPNVTYGWLARERAIIGDAIGGKNQAYPNADTAGLKRLYAAMADDQMANVERIGGAEMRKQLQGANRLYAKKAALEKRIVEAYGKDTEGSLANLMRRAVTSGSKGDVAPLNKMLKVIPKENHKEAVLSAIMATTRAKGGMVKGGFGFSEFASAYQGLRANAPVYSKVASIIGEEGQDLLKDMYVISKRITDARANVLQTGKANQAIYNSLTAESLMAKVLSTAAGRATVTGAAAVGGGPAGAMAATALSGLVNSGKTDAMRRAGALFASPEFQQLMVEAATNPTVSKSTVSALALSKAFKRFTNEMRLPQQLSQREQWISRALLGGNSQRDKNDKKEKL